MIRTLGLGLSLTALPSFMSAKMAYVSPEALDPGEFIIPVTERDLSDMQKFIEECIEANKDADPQAAVKEVLANTVR